MRQRLALLTPGGGMAAAAAAAARPTSPPPTSADPKPKPFANYFLPLLQCASRCSTRAGHRSSTLSCLC
jgi:hypothetical protein